MTSPLVSIVTPSYNQANYIEDCILSVKKQTYSNIEHIIIDACSNDNTKEIISNYVDSYNLKYLIEPDDGPAQALNKGFNLAQGDIFCWLNSDDYYLNNQAIQRVIDYYNLYDSVDVITGRGYEVDCDGKWIRPVITEHKMISVEKIKNTAAMLQPATFWKAEVHLTLNEELQYVFDWVLFIKLFLNGANVLSVNDYFSAYRIHESSRTAYDNADRKREVAGVLKSNFGKFSTQYLWGIYIFFLYKLSEVVKLSVVKDFAILSNQLMNKLSFGRVVSC